MMKKISLIATLLYICCANMLATSQMPDKILYQGQRLGLFTNPMDSYFEQNPDKKPKPGIVSTALMRGYVASFEVKDGELFVTESKYRQMAMSGKV